MKRALALASVAALLLGIFAPRALHAQEGASASAQEGVMKLPPPQTDGGMPLMKALMKRASSREYSAEKLPPQLLSNLLWAANGINRPESGKHTAPTARNMQEIDVYVALEEGLYLYDAKEHALKLTLKQDVRAATGMQPFVKDAPVNLVLVVDFAKMGDMPKEMKDFYAAGDASFISQNVYLFCASEGLATVVRGAVNRDECAKAMQLGPDQKVIWAQTVGYPKR